MMQDQSIHGGFHAPRAMLRARLLAVQATVAGALVTLMLGTVALLAAMSCAQAADGLSVAASSVSRVGIGALLLTLAFGLGTATWGMARATARQARSPRNRDRRG